MIFTTNKPLNEWGKVLHDEDMAAAILDRVLERGRYIHLDGPSGRTRHLNLEETLPVGADRARISGISGSEFPEPTPPIALQREMGQQRDEIAVRVGRAKCPPWDCRHDFGILSHRSWRYGTKFLTDCFKKTPLFRCGYFLI